MHATLRRSSIRSLSPASSNRSTHASSNLPECAVASPGSRGLQRKKKTGAEAPVSNLLLKILERVAYRECPRALLFACPRRGKTAEVVGSSRVVFQSDVTEREFRALRERV